MPTKRKPAPAIDLAEPEATDNATTQHTPDTPAFLADYRPVVGQRTRHDGWTAERQRRFLTVLAETGCISEACNHAGVSSRSAYRLRQLPNAKDFAEGWDTALRLATIRLTTVAFERAVRGTVREFWKNGELIATTRTPSDKLLTFLLQHLLATGGPASRLDAHDQSVAQIRDGFPATLARLVDQSVEMVPIQTRDFFPESPGDPTEDW